jgi:hypothetical protein
MKNEMNEGPQTREKFERAMKAAFRVSKDEIKEAERKDKANRKRKKR